MTKNFNFFDLFLKMFDTTLKTWGGPGFVSISQDFISFYFMEIRFANLIDNRNKVSTPIVLEWQGVFSFSI